MLKRLQRMLCKHVCSQRQMHREADGMVCATCCKCGAVLRAEYGLALPLRRARETVDTEEDKKT